MAAKGLLSRSEVGLSNSGRLAGLPSIKGLKWTAFRQKTKQIVITSPEPEQTGVRNNKVDAIGRFLTKLSKPSNYNQALIEELNKFNLKNFREDLASALAEAVLTKFDLTLMVKGERALTIDHHYYLDNIYR
jgi:hypothetical protein